MTPAETRIVGNYRLLTLIGSGGTSRVYAAEHQFLGETAAVKLLRDELAGEVADAFVEEAAQTRAIEHPNVVRVIDCGRDPATGCYYLVMERLVGGTLAAHLDRKGPLPEAEVRRLGIALAEGMAAVHGAGVVHRDLKPANVMLTASGDPKIVDFGIAKHLAGGRAITTSRRIGTPAYMAPEQLTGGLISPAVDVWALGVILFEASTGRLPFEVANGACPQLVEDAPRAGVSPALDDAIARCLVRDPGRRIGSMTSAIELLRAGPVDRITEDAGPIARSIGGPQTAPAPRRRSSRAWWLAGAAAAAIGVAVALLVARTDPPEAPAAVAVAQPDPTPVQPPERVEPTQPADDPPQAIRRPRAVATWSIDVRSEPSGATIVIDGKVRGTTPATLRVRPRAALELRLNRYLPQRLRVERPGALAITLQEDLN